jgi:hypothetical protein
MGLDLMPRATGPNSEKFERGILHLESQPCPFKDLKRAHGVLATCCSFRANLLAHYLLSLWLIPQLLRLYDNKLPEEAIEYAAGLRLGMKETQEALLGVWNEDRRRAGKSLEQAIDDMAIEDGVIGWKFELKDAFAEIEAAARWHERVGRMHAGIHAWY